jgi:hypothetical protein
MAITASVESLSEEGFVAALQAHADLTAVIPSGSIRRYQDASETHTYPTVTVRCAEVVTPSYIDQNTYIAHMEIAATTRKSADDNGDIANSAIAAIRDAIATGAAFITTFESVGGIDVTLVRKPAARSTDFRRFDTGRTRRRVLIREVVLRTTGA